MNTLNFLRELFFIEILSGELSIEEDDFYKNHLSIRVYECLNKNDLAFIVYEEKKEFMIYDFSSNQHHKNIEYVKYNKNEFISYMKRWVYSYRK